MNDVHLLGLAAGLWFLYQGFLNADLGKNRALILVIYCVLAALLLFYLADYLPIHHYVAATPAVDDSNNVFHALHSV